MPEYLANFHLQAEFLPLSLGCIVGFILALTGAGGAILSVPLLVFGMHLTVAEAGPIGLFAVTLSAGIGSILALGEKILRYKATALMAIFGLALSPIGLYIARITPNKPLTILFALVLMYVAIKSLYQYWQSVQHPEKLIRNATPPCILDGSIGKLIWTVPCARSLAFTGCLAGFFSGLLGVGGGFIIVPSLKRVTDLPMKSIVATSMGVLTIVSLGGVIGATLYGHMQWGIALPFAAGALTGLLLGKTVSKSLTGTTIQNIFSVFMLVVAALMFHKTLA